MASLKQFFSQTIPMDKDTELPFLNDKSIIITQVALTQPLAEGTRASLTAHIETLQIGKQDENDEIPSKESDVIIAHLQMLTLFIFIPMVQKWSFQVITFQLLRNYPIMLNNFFKIYYFFHINKLKLIYHIIKKFNINFINFQIYKLYIFDRKNKNIILTLENKS